MPRSDHTAQHSRFVMLAAVCVVVAALYFAQDVLMPLALAMLLSFLLTPLVSRLERRHLHRVPSVIIVVTLALMLVAAIGYGVWKQAFSLAEELPTYKDNIIHKFQRMRPSDGSVLSRARQAIEDVGKNLEAAPPAATQASPATPLPGSPLLHFKPSTAPAASSQPVVPAGSEHNPIWTYVHDPPATPFRVAEDTLGPILGPLGTAGIVIVFTIFILLAREDLRDRIIRLFGRGQLTVTTQALDDAAERISRYLLMQSIVNGTYGLAIGLGLWVIGVPNPLLFGLICGVIRFIPYIGPWIGASLPILLALARFPGYKELVETLGLFVVVELISNNAVEPWLYGSSTGMSTVAVLVSAVFWAWLWGPVGLLLSTPLTVVLVVIGKYVPQLQFLDILLGDEPVLAPPVRVYQRLLALDQEEAIELLREYRKALSLEEVYDQVVLPALAMAEQDRQRGQLDDRRQSFVRQSMHSIVEELGDDEQVLASSEETRRVVAEAKDRASETPGLSGPAQKENGLSKRVPVPRDCVVNIVCLPAHDEADEIVNLMLAQLLQINRYCAFSISQNALASEMVEQVSAHKAHLVVVSALPPAAVAHARYLCKRMHAADAEMKMIVGLWTFKGDLTKAKDRITCVANVPLVTSLTAAIDEIHQQVQPMLMSSATRESAPIAGT
jgi:predicted PurR-regulated permease PerM